MSLWSSILGFFRKATDSRRLRTAVHSTNPLRNRIGKAITPLRVYGIIEINGKRYEARCRFNQIIRAGTRIRVVGAENFALVVEAAEA